MNEILFLAIFFLATFIIGRLMEHVRIPWIFAALLIGLLLAIYNPVPQLTSNAPMALLSELGMYFLLFIIGFELDMKKLFKSSRFVVRTTVIVIFLETLLGGLFIHYFFSINFMISFLVALSFATVGEAVLLPILEEFKILGTKIGQTMLGIGVLDDIIEVASVAFVVIILGKQIGHASISIWGNIFVLSLLFVLTFLIVRFRKHLTHFKYKDIPSFFLFVIFFIFLFVGIGLYVESAALGALLAGVALRSLIPHDILSLIESEIKALAYGLFAPIYFLTVGLSVDVSYLVTEPIGVLAILFIITSAAIIGVFLSSNRELNAKQSLVLGLGLSVKLSTSIVILKLLLDSGLIGLDAYSALIGATILFLFLIPLIMSALISRWRKQLLH